MPYGLIVRFQARAADRERFLELVRQNATTSVANEPGCLRFDVLSSSEEVFLYEIYKDEAAFAAHLLTAHFTAFDATSQSLVLSKQVITGTLSENAKAPDRK